jgi:hypothetical protein
VNSDSDSAGAPSDSVSSDDDDEPTGDDDDDDVSDEEEEEEMEEEKDGGGDDADGDAADDDDVGIVGSGPISELSAAISAASGVCISCRWKMALRYLSIWL